MKPRALFRLLLKLLGVNLFVAGVCSLAASGLQIFAMMQASISASSRSPYVYAQLAQPILECLIGYYLFFGGEWIVERAVPDSRPRCPQCQYDLSHASGAVCPECGTPLDPLPAPTEAT